MPKLFSFLLSLLLTLHLDRPVAAGNGHDGSPGSGGATDIFILAGQSNMAGRGGVDHGKWNGVVPSQSAPSPSILRLSAGMKWEPAAEPLHVGIDLARNKTCGVGPGMAFANSLLLLECNEKKRNWTGSGAGRAGVAAVGLVPCAVGGTRIRQWRRGKRLYGRMLRRARAAGRGGGGGRIRGVLWYQGESDTMRRQDAEGYKGNLERLIVDFRSDLGIPSLPFLLVALASGEGKFVEEVRKAQLTIKLANVHCVDAKGLGLKTDHLHLTTTSEVKLGQKLARAFLNRFSHWPLQQPM